MGGPAGDRGMWPSSVGARFAGKRRIHAFPAVCDCDDVATRRHGDVVRVSRGPFTRYMCKSPP
jgi:hypothetical protein